MTAIDGGKSNEIQLEGRTTEGQDGEWEGERSREWEGDDEFLFGMRREVRKSTESIFMSEQECQARLFVLRRASEGMVYGNEEEE